MFKNVELKIYKIVKNVRYNSHAPTYIIFLGSYPRRSFGVVDLDFDTS